MANLSVRKLDDNIYARLRIRATNHAVSIEEEARRIISKAVSAPEHISEVFRKHFGPHNGIELESTSQQIPHEPMDF